MAGASLRFANFQEATMSTGEQILKTQNVLDQQTTSIDPEITKEMFVLGESKMIAVEHMDGQFCKICIGDVVNTTQNNNHTMIGSNITIGIFDYTLHSNTNLSLTSLTYYNHDHLGNTRVTYSPIIDCSGTTPMISYDLKNAFDYYPYGKVLRSYENGDEKYLTTHHERDKETGLDYRGARYYDGDIGRFLSLDPKAANYPSLSDYNYVAGNPVIFVDTDGKEVKFADYWMDSPMDAIMRENARQVLAQIVGLSLELNIAGEVTLQGKSAKSAKKFMRKYERAVAKDPESVSAARVAKAELLKMIMDDNKHSVDIVKTEGAITSGGRQPMSTVTKEGNITFDQEYLNVLSANQDEVTEDAPRRSIRVKTIVQRKAKSDLAQGLIKRAGARIKRKKKDNSPNTLPGNR